MILRIFKTLVILFLIALIAGVACGSYWFLVYYPKEQAKRLYAAEGFDAGKAPVDPSLGEYQKLKAIPRTAKPSDVRVALENFLNRFPESSHAKEIEAWLGGLNIDQFFSGQLDAKKSEYMVKKGDSLVKISSQQRIPPELIFRLSGLDGINLQVGQRLLVPNVEFALEIHLNDKRVVLLDRGQFFRSYIMQSVNTPKKKDVRIQSKVASKYAYRAGKQITFSSRNFDGSARVINLAQSGYTIFSEPEPEAVAQGMAEEAPTSAGIGLSQGDAEELYVLASVGMPVSITSE